MIYDSYLDGCCLLETVKTCTRLINIMTYALSNSHGVLTHNCYLFMFQ
jgi:hypothetical protein